MQREKIEVDLGDLKYALEELEKFKKECFRLWEVEREHKRLVKLTDKLLEAACPDKVMGVEFGPVQELQKQVFAAENKVGAPSV